MTEIVKGFRDFLPIEAIGAIIRQLLQNGKTE